MSGATRAIFVSSESYRRALEDAEKQIYEDALKAARYNQSKAAGMLGVSRGTFRAKMKQYFGNKYIGTREG